MDSRVVIMITRAPMCTITPIPTHTHSLAVLDAMRFPYKMETTKVYIRRKDEDGNELPPKCTMVSKVTMLPKELAGEATAMHEYFCNLIVCVCVSHEMP